MSFDPTPLLDDRVIHPPLDLEVDRRMGVVLVEAQPQFVAILVTVDRPPIDLQVVAIEVQVMDRVRQIRATRAILVDLEIARHEIAYRKR